MELLREIPETEIQAESAFSEYPAAENAEGQSPFLNGVIRIETELPPLELLHKLQVIERKMGRSAKGDSSPRPIDLDILSLGEGVLFEGKNLTVPHPKIHQRRFVLEPLVEIEPDWKHPKLGKTAKELLEELCPPPYEDSQDTESAQERPPTVSS